jgi:UDP-N-acetylmuramyl pentapeptide phosphotransferase/UDP-N-acetylglucosamine-1-phosphate transferase
VSTLGLAAIPLLSLVVAMAVTGYLASSRAQLRWLDHPNERSLHTRPVPRTGGLGMLAGIAVGWAALAWLWQLPGGWPWVLVSVFLVAGVSAWDDRHGLGALPRLLVHLAAAALLLGAGLFPPTLELPGVEWAWPHWLAAVLAVPFVVWMVNLYNFMDGMDGLAGGMAVIGFACMSVLGFAAGDHGFGLFTLVVAAGAGGFLVFNFPPARIFMGDAGASTLGLLAAVAMLWADRAGIFPLWAGMLIFSPFIVDATGTLLARIRAGERFWEAHRRHCYQILVRYGWGHRRTASRAYVLMLLVGTTTVAAVLLAAPALQMTVILVWTVVYGILWYRIRGLERSF